ncbi:potassium-transporting ATPase subunit C, partial [Mycobacterium sp.]|uniref:potassium-transporting ATPase subunit C n=1 Tax=Mycobacterium sp. TaxID=1785 RepID=UPI003BAE1DA5
PASAFQQFYEGVRVQCAQYGQDYSSGQIVPVRGAAPDHPVVPTDAVTASASGLDPDISAAYADIQVARVASTRGISAAQVRAAVSHNQHARLLGVFGEPTVNVVALNLQLDRELPVKS